MADVVTIVETAGTAIAGTAAVFGALWKPFVRKHDQRVNDDTFLHGVSARPGIPGLLPAGERLSAVEVGVQNAGGRPKQTTTGALSHEGSMTLYLSGAQAFERDLMTAAVAKGLVRNGAIAQISLVRFQIDYLWTPPGAVEIYERRLKGCRLLSDTESPAEGTDPGTVDYKIYVLERVKVIDGREVSLL